MNRKLLYIVFIIFSLALVLRFVAVCDMDPALEGDPATYNHYAKSIAEKGEFADAAGRPTSWRPPLYPLFLAVIYLLAGESLCVVGAVQAVIGSLACVLIYFIAKDVFGKTTGITAGAISACYLYFIASARFLTTEGLFIFMFVLSVFLLFKAIEYNSLKYAVCTGFLLGLTTLVRAEVLFFPLFVFMAILLVYKTDKERLVKLIKLSLIALVAFLIPISVWTIRNYSAHKAFVPVSTNGGINFFIGNTPNKDGRNRVRGPAPEEVADIEVLESEVEKSRAYMKKALVYVSKHPKKVSKLVLMKFFFFWSPFDWFFLGDKGTYNYHYAFIFPFSIAGILLSVKKFKERWLLYVPLVYFLTTSLVFNAEPRYRMSITPFLIIFASAGLVSFFKRFNKKIIPALITAAFLCLNYAGFMFSSIVKENARNIFCNLGLW